MFWVDTFITFFNDVKVQICIYVIRIIIIISEDVDLMNYYLKNSPLEDLRRINSGYMPKNHFMFLYNTIPIFIMLKMFVYRTCGNFISGNFSFESLHKSFQIRKSKTKNAITLNLR
ncbi:MAG: hypothetical protein C3F06_07620 [Candidatus Methanoperedenaceae archaeon]|nr:MAG: hypothetical protein C3F06_07620 [Candidatus Methanoperedenaceae archaeon]